MREKKDITEQLKQAHCEGNSNAQQWQTQRAARADAACCEGRYTALVQKSENTSGKQGVLKQL